MKRYALDQKMKRMFTAAFLVILLLAAGLFAGISGSMYRKQAYQFCVSQVELNLNILDSRLQQIQTKQRVLAADSVIRNAVEYQVENETVDYSIELYHQRDVADKLYMLSENPEIENAYIVSADGRCLYSYRASVRKDYNLMQEEWLKDIVDSIYLNTSYVSGMHDKRYLLTDQKNECISMVMPITRENQYAFSAAAYLVCDIDPMAVLQSSRSADGGVSLALAASGRLLYAKESRHLAEEEEEQILARIDEEKSSFQLGGDPWGTDRLVVVMKSRFFGWNLVGIRSLDEIHSINRKLSCILAGILLLSVLLVALISRIVSKSILTPMNRLVDCCNQVAVGNYEVEFPEGKSEEIHVLSQTVQTMIHNVFRLSEKVVEEEKKLSEEQLRALQHQINPHFLNNVLQLIKGMAVEGKTEEISRLSTLLGKILAYSVYQPYEDVELKEELEYVKNYMEIQNLRYGGRIFYAIDCEPGLENVRISKLLIQPLVENAIEHGIKGKGRGMISISAERERDSICILVNDNGTGIPEPELADMKRKLEAETVYLQEKSIGVLNVNARLKRKYGGRYGIEVISREGAGTTVIIRLPEDGEGKDNENITGR